MLDQFHRRPRDPNTQHTSSLGHGTAYLKNFVSGVVWEHGAYNHALNMPSPLLRTNVLQDTPEILLFQQKVDVIQKEPLKLT